MDNERMLMRAILEDPADDTVRLAYADEIQDADPERAEFIRVQIELPRLFSEHRCDRGLSGGFICTPGVADWGCRSCESFIKRRDELTDRERELVRNHYRKWADWDLPGILRTGHYANDSRLFWVWKRTKPRVDCAFPIVFKRGFVAEVACETRDWVAHGAEVVLKQPITHMICEGPSPSNVARRTGGGPNSRCYAWFRTDSLGNVRTSTIPNKLWPDPAKRRCNFATEALARTALSNWCVDYGRREAGLKPLTRPVL